MLNKKKYLLKVLHCMEKVAKNGDIVEDLYTIRIYSNNKRRLEKQLKYSRTMTTFACGAIYNLEDD